MAGLQLSPIQTRVRLLERENEVLQRESRFQNLILHGLAEKPVESTAVLKRAVMEVLASTCNRHVIFDTVYRLGMHGDITTRPVRIRFLSHATRNGVFEKRRNVPAGLALKEDLPFKLRRDHSILRRKRNQLSGSGIRSIIDWKGKTLYGENGSYYRVRNGELVEVVEGDNFASRD